MTHAEAPEQAGWGMARAQIVLTIDIDWAPDFAIDFVAERLMAGGCRATWFVTHESPAVRRLANFPELFDLGIHPNFLPGSSHGNTQDEVLDHCMSLVPNALSMRTHCLVQSTPLLANVMARTPISVDVSLFLPDVPALQPFEYQWSGRTLLRVPYIWEDDFEMERSRPNWNANRLLRSGGGPKVFDFHPIHVYLNSPNAEQYREVKRRYPDLTKVTESQLASHVHSGAGTRTLFADLLERVAGDFESVRIKDIYELWRDGSPALKVG